MNPSPRSSAATAAFLSVLFCNLSPAANLVWDSNGVGSGVNNGSGMWDDSTANWRAAGPTYVAWDSFADPLDSALFGGAGTVGPAGAIEVSSGGVAVMNMTFRTPQSGSFSLFGGEIDLSGVVTNTHAANVSISSVISGTGSLTRSLGGTLTLSGANTYSGATTITDGATVDLTAGSIAISSAVNVVDGTLLVGGSDNNIKNSAAVTLGSGSGGSGKLQLTGTVTETAGSLTLAAAGQIIDMGSGSGMLTFSSLGGAGSLKVYNYTGGGVGVAGTTDRIFLANGSLGGVPTTNIQFYSDNGVTMIGLGGDVLGTELVPVPEVATVGALAALIAPVCWRQRRRRA